MPDTLPTPIASPKLQALLNVQTALGVFAKAEQTLEFAVNDLEALGVVPDAQGGPPADIALGADGTIVGTTI